MKLQLLCCALLATACDSSSAPESPPDASSPDDAASGSVTLHVWDRSGAPAVGRAVAFLAPDGTPVAELVTDATGTVFASLPDGGSVTVAAEAVKASSGRPNMYTYLGVKNGDELTVGAPKRVPPMPRETLVRLPSGVAPGAENFHFHSSCNLNAGNTTNERSVTMDVRADCTMADFYVEALDGGYEPIAATYAPDQAIAGTIDIGTSFAPLVTSTLTLENVPELTEVTPALDLVVGSFYPVVTNNFAVRVTDGIATKTSRHARIPDASLEMRVRLGDLGERLVVRRAQAPVDTTIDLATANLPEVTEPGTYHAPSTVVWSEAGGAVDVATVTLRVREGTTRDFDWIIVGPHAGASLQVPSLSGALAPFAITPSAEVTVLFTGIGAFPGGYDRVRPLVFRGDNDGSTSDFFDPYLGGDRRSGLAHVTANGDDAVIATR